MKSKEIIGFSIVAVIGLSAYLFFSKGKKTLKLTTGDGVLKINTSELECECEKENAKELTLNEKRYTEKDAAVKAVFSKALVSKYLSNIPDLETNEINAENSLNTNDTLKSKILAFKKGGLKASSVFENFLVYTLPKMSMEKADKLIKIYPKLFLQSFFKEFNTFKSKHAVDYELTPSESLIWNEINYDKLFEEFENKENENIKKRFSEGFTGGIMGGVMFAGTR